MKLIIYLESLPKKIAYHLRHDKEIVKNLNIKTKGGRVDFWVFLNFLKTKYSKLKDIGINEIINTVKGDEKQRFSIEINGIDIESWKKNNSDKSIKNEFEKNELESIIYTLKKSIQDIQSKLSINEIQIAENEIKLAQEVLDSDNINRIRSVKDSLYQFIKKLGISISENPKNSITIRANQGHSSDTGMEPDLNPVPDNLVPIYLFHGTKLENIKNIKKNGLNAGSRHHVHLADNIKLAEKRAPIIIKINAKEMIQNGWKFLRSTNGVYFPEKDGQKTIPPEFLNVETI